MGKFLKIKERIMAAENEAFDSTNFANKPLLFGKWNYEELNITDKTMEIYVSVHTSKQKVFVPHTAGRYQLKRFIKAMRIVKSALDIIHHHTGVNPLQILCDAICNCGPREDSTRIGRGGTVKRQACDVSSFRRVNQGIYFLANAARNKGMRTIKHISEILADEIMSAAKGSPNCSAIKKKEEIEKNAKANR